MTETPARFQDHIELLRVFLTHREHIVESIEAVLNAQRKPPQYLQDRALLSRLFEDCFYSQPSLTANHTRLKGQIEAAYWAMGFKPRQVQHAHNDLIHPAEIAIRAFHCWQQTRWPGHNGRVHFAHTLFNLYLLRCLQFLSLRLWDDDPAAAPARLAQLQQVLDQLWNALPAGQPAFVRDARWLIPLAQSLITDELAPYLEVARLVAETLPEADALEIQKAHLRMLGGHLTSQIRYYSTNDRVPIHDPSVVVRTRTSNALDFALLIQGLVALLHAYDRALHNGDEHTRLDMAAAIWQGISADPELFLNRIPILSAYSMIEHVFLAPGPAYSSLGQRHVRLLNEYTIQIARLIEPLREDLPRFKPLDGGCSPYGVIFGLPSHLIEHMALKAIQHDAETRFSLEDIFNDGGDRAAKLAWVNGWRDLPHIDPELQRAYAYPQRFAEEIYELIHRELTQRELTQRESTTGRLYIGPNTSSIPDLPAQYFVSSPSDPAQLLRDRQEAHFLLSYQTPGGGWIAIKKELLTGVLAAGLDARIASLPPEAVEALRLMCPGLNATPQSVG